MQSHVLRAFLVLGVYCLAWSSILGAEKEAEPSAVSFEDEPAAHALYDRMVKAMREADSLYYQRDYRWEAQGRELGHATYCAEVSRANRP